MVRTREVELRQGWCLEKVCERKEREKQMISKKRQQKQKQRNIFERTVIKHAELAA